MFEGEEGPFGGIEVEIPDADIAEYEQEMPEGSDHREWHVPHDVANRYLAGAKRVEFYPEGYLQTYEGYWIVRGYEEEIGTSVGGASLRAALPVYKAVDPETLSVVAETSRLPELMLSIHNDLPRKA
jgi:hypothetical protein